MRWILLTCMMLAMMTLPASADETVRITWTAPTSGGSVEGYELVASYNGTEQVIYDGAPNEWTGVLTEGDWTFRVRAYNRSGFGPWSEWSDSALIMSPPGGCGLPVLEVL